MVLILLYRARFEIRLKKISRDRDNGRGRGDGASSIPSPTGGFDDVERMLQGEDNPLPPKKSSYLFTEEISFLYEAYKPEYWYWEVRQNVEGFSLKKCVTLIHYFEVQSSHVFLCPCCHCSCPY